VLWRAVLWREVACGEVAKLPYNYINTTVFLLQVIFCDQRD
jgi:hypothetical protein